MRTVFLAIIVAAIPAASFAQPTRAYVSGVGGFATTGDEGTSGNVLGEGGFRVAPHTFVFGNIGHFNNLMPSEVQPAVSDATAALSALGVDVTGNPKVPAWYSSGGVRAEIPVFTHFMPYVFGSVGFARLTPHATFSYTSGTLGDGSYSAGDDVTTQVVSLGEFTQPPSATEMMFSTGGGIEAPIAARIVLDAGYRFSRVNGDEPLHTQGLTFGIGYRF